MKYIKLLDKENKNMIVKADGRKQYTYVFGKNEWVRTGILMQYFDEKYGKYDLYKEISEQEALNIINEQKKEYETMYKYMLSEVKNKPVVRKEIYDFLVHQGGFGDTEIDIVGLIYCLGIEYYQKIKNQEKNNERIMKSLSILYEKTNFEDETHLVALRTNTNAHNIIKLEILERVESGILSKEKYELLKDYFDNKITFLDEEQKQILAK